MKLLYPASHEITRLNDALLSIKIARHSSCTVCNSCTGLHPLPGITVASDDIEVNSLHDLTQYGSDDDDGSTTTYLLSCACGHSAVAHNADICDLDRDEFTRRGLVGIRLDELLQDKGKLLDFSYIDEDIVSLKKQMHLPKFLNSPSIVPSSPDQSSVILPPLSPASSILSDPPQPPNKRRRISTSSLSEEEDDEDEDQPLAARMATNLAVDRPEMTARKAPAHRSGKKTSSMKSKGQIGLVSTMARHNQDLLGSRRVNGVKSHEAKVKVEDTLDENQLTRLATGVTVDAGGPTSPAQPVKTEKAAVVELRKGIIHITPVENDGTARSLVILTGLKTLFQKQLPKMPREYIARLVYDENSKALAIIKRGFKVVGGICYRPFPHRDFAEIVFFATSSADQEKGYGGMLMDHFKTHIKRTYPKMMHFLTYADNYAVGYFWKQGFTKDITLDRSIWAGYIKDYEGGTIMQCTMLRKFDYLDKASIIAQQREAILTKIRDRSKSHIVYPGLPQFQDGSHSEITVGPQEVPGLSETGWTPASMPAPPARATPRTAEHHFMQRLLSDLQGHPQAWAFLNPVNAEEVVDYYEVIKRPMDFSTIEHKLHTNQYNSLENFADDVQLVFDNCRTYNPEGSIYAKNATRVEKYFRDELVERTKQEA